MDALKKAEASKRQTDAQAAPGRPAELTLDALTPKPARSSEPPATPSPQASERAAARQLFAAKQPAIRRSPIIVFAGFAALAALLILAYFWWQLQAGKRSSLVPGGTANSALATPGQPGNSNATTPATAPPQLAPVPASVADAPQSGNTSRPPLPDGNAGTARVADNAEKTGMANMASAAAAGLVPVLAAASDERTVVRRGAPRQQAASTTTGEGERALHVSSSGAKTDSVLMRAYLALQEGRLEDARHDYEVSLQRDPRNLDALLGLALVASRQGRSAQAEALYLRALEANPVDPDAQAGLINLRGQGDPLQAESRLKILLASQPESPALNFALGNVLSRQDRWSEAQQAYFRAWTAAPENADILYNLAVSLDHLRQGKLAAQHYRMALEASARRPAAFDSTAVQRRIGELQP